MMSQLFPQIQLCLLFLGHQLDLVDPVDVPVEYLIK